MIGKEYSSTGTSTRRKASHDEGKRSNHIEADLKGSERYGTA